MRSYTAPYIPNLKGVAPAVPEIQDPETWQIFFVFFFFAPNIKLRITQVFVHRFQ